jgi:prepilin-type N-terminal cleavage/methylation domain-containing protein
MTHIKTYKYSSHQKGFTLIEAMVAIFILTIALSSLISLTASSVFSARYAANEMTAGYLLQEVADYVRNDRDTTVFENNGGGVGWANFINKYGNGSSTLCFSVNGCYFEPTSISTVPPTICPGGTCPALNYDKNATYNAFYTYRSLAGSTASIFRRKVIMKINVNNPDELDVKVVLDWYNGGAPRTRVLNITLLNWQRNN